MANETMTPAVATPRTVMTGARVQIEFALSYMDTRRWADGGIHDKTPAEMAEMLEQKCREFEAFVRDHRSQDPVRLTVVRESEEQCSVCDHTWDPTTENGVVCCGWCGASTEAAS